MKKKIIRVLRQLGPGLVTGASHDDPSGIITYSQAGAKFGLATLWTALFTFPLIAGVQAMCARIGLVTSKGLTLILKENYSKKVLYLTMIFGVPAMTMNIGADIQGIGAVAHLIFPEIPVTVYCIGFTVLMTFGIIKYPYKKITNFLKWLCLILLLYIIVPFMKEQNWLQIVKDTVIPPIELNKDYILIIVAILGTTISPYLFYWQVTMEAEDKAHDLNIIKKKRSEAKALDKRMLEEIKLDEMKTDVNLGMFLSNVIMFFIILTAGSVLYNSGVHNIQTIDQAAKALEPLTGKVTYLMFSAGVISSGLLSVPIVAGAQSYLLSEIFGWKTGLNKKFRNAKAFYITISFSLFIGLMLNFLKISPIDALIYTAMLYGLTTPVFIAIILHVANNRKIMKDKTNNLWSNLLGFLTLILMTGAAIALIYLSVQ